MIQLLDLILLQEKGVVTISNIIGKVVDQVNYNWEHKWYKWI